MNDLTTLTTKICVMPSAGGCLLTLRDSISKRLRENRACGKMRHSYNPRENIAEDAVPNDVDRLRVLSDPDRNGDGGSDRRTQRA